MKLEHKCTAAVSPSVNDHTHTIDYTPTAPGATVYLAVTLFGINAVTVVILELDSSLLRLKS